MMRRPWMVLSIVFLVGAAATGALILVRQREAAPVVPNEARADGLTLLVVRTRSGPFGAVIGSTGARDGALVVPGEIQLTIPGQGDATLSEALELPPREAATTVANMLGVWVDHYVVFGTDRLAEVVDRAGGIEVGGDELTGAETVSMLESSDPGAAAAFALVVDGLLQADAGWEQADFAKSDAPADALADFQASNGATASSLPVDEAATDVFLAQPEDVRAALVDVFGGPDREVVNVIVLNGSGLPGVGELVAEQIVPDGFRVVVSENAANFDHQETLVVVGSADDVALGERVRDLLGTGSVNVSVASGIAPVTIVVGKDFAG